MSDEVKSVSRAEVTRSFGVSAFPIDLWSEWDEDCKKTFGDCRWLKMWNDHLQAKDSIKYEILNARVEELEASLQVLQNNSKEESEKKPSKATVKTFNKELSGGD